MSEARVWAGALLSGPDTIVIAAANHIPASKPDPPAIYAATRNLTTSKSRLTSINAVLYCSPGSTVHPCTLKFTVRDTD